MKQKAKGCVLQHGYSNDITLSLGCFRLAYWMKKLGVLNHQHLSSIHNVVQIKKIKYFLWFLKPSVSRKTGTNVP